MQNTSTRDLDLQLATLKRQQAEAERLERQRIEAEQAHARKIQETQSEIDRLQNQRRQAAFTEAIDQNTVLIEQHNQRLMELLTVFNGVLPSMATLEPAFNEAVETFQRQQAHKNHAVGAALDGLTFNPNMPGYNPTFPESEQRRWYGEQVGRHASQIKNAIAPGNALLEWITAASDPTEIRIRQAMVFVISGRIIEVSKDFNAQVATDTAIANQMNR